MIGIVLVSHLEEIASGIKKLLQEFNKTVAITFAKTNGAIGTTFEAVQAAIDENPAEEILVFYDLGSSKINAQLVIDLGSTKQICILDTALLESAFLATNLIGFDQDFKTIIAALRAEELKSKTNL
ncbi:hypothetical protein SCLARK_001166 [Spiroplasma clarkii]|uniref:PTS-dependent dihydroxyacetone kinase phosphotransferase subunit DhaM n=1 Tax=Spiroplasma clarkii TaxID=2139 RepID=A0A1Y0L133_9MOLU|nr:PTS mannose family transporter subunit IIA [Spiroplasma clarkii]ARU91724.1 hypothetical protein SCLARK_001166 [Spiroplasma clarkii]ATX71107.1 PTS-dependent dihydroxyacetone kinase phosphotransferase subunit DhaM [Spiroplasma clarkii]